MEKVGYLNQPNCLRLSNGTVEAIVTTDIGPRVVHYGLVSGENLLGEALDAKVETQLGEWKPWGGHRLWHAPEVIPRTYVPDNAPIEAEELGPRTVRLVQPVEEETGIRKEMTITLGESGTGLTLEHKLTNTNRWAVDLAPWALTIMNGTGGGTVILPQEPYRSHDDCLLPARPVVLWHYTDLADPRWALGPTYVRLTVNDELPEPQKLGIANKQGWAAYAHGHTLFVKRFPYRDGAAYPDCGCNCEVYTAGAFVEVETLGPLCRLEPGESAEHPETWGLFDDVEIGDTEESVGAALGPRVGGAA